MNVKSKRIILFSTVAVLIAVVAIVVVLKIKDANAIPIGGIIPPIITAAITW